MLLLLLLANLLLWAAAIGVFRRHPLMLGNAALAYGFGLRHAVDADHIAAIDNVTRKLMQQGRRPLRAGLFFSLGHSTVVFGLVATIAALALHGAPARLARWGGVFGTLISAGFLLALGLMNLKVLRRLVLNRRHPMREMPAPGGVLARLFGPLFRLVEHEWQMFPVGFLFGLGFDTATEVGLLGISAMTAGKGVPAWSILMFPALFAAGMALVDSADSVLMVSAYGWAFLKPRRKLFYNIAITALSVLVALAVGLLEVLGLIQASWRPAGGFWNGIAALNGNFGFTMLGYGMIGFFAAAWAVSILLHRLRRVQAVTE